MFETERALIKGLMMGGKLNLSLSPTDFEAYGDVWKVIQNLILRGKNVDFATISAEFPDTTKLLDCVRSEGTAAMVDDYASIVRESSQKRALIKLLHDTERRINENTDNLYTITDSVRDALAGLEDAPTGWTEVDDVMIKTFEYLEARAEGKIKSVTTGVAKLDEFLGGFFPGELTVIGARPAVGKSAFAMNIAHAAAIQGFSVGILSREMTGVQYGTRLISRVSDVSGTALRKARFSEDEWADVSDAMSEIAKLNISFLFNVKTVEDLRRNVQQRHEKGMLDLLIVDYLQLMDTSSDYKADYLRVAKISKALKDIAVDYNMPVIALAQVNRNTDGKMPDLKDLKDSGSIEQDADGVIFLHKPESDKDDSIPARDKGIWINYFNNPELEYIIVKVAKQRQGMTGNTSLEFDKSHMSYRPIEYPERR